MWQMKLNNSQTWFVFDSYCSFKVSSSFRYFSMIFKKLSWVLILEETFERPLLKHICESQRENACSQLSMEKSAIANWMLFYGCSKLTIKLPERPRLTSFCSLYCQTQTSLDLENQSNNFISNFKHYFIVRISSDFCQYLLHIILLDIYQE